MSFITYILFRFFVALFYIFPFWVIYGISDFFAVLLYFLVGYRKKVIIKNLKNAFPTKSEKELKKLLFPIYRNISDLMVETIKGFSMSPKQVMKHIKTTNVELMHDLYNRKKGIIGVLGHYGNWEWAALLAGLKLKQGTVALYKPLSNKFLDAYMRKNRARFGIKLSSIYATAKTFDEHKNDKMLFALVADQSPSNINKSFWVDFLNQPTACLHGPEKYSKMFDMPVVYIHIIRKKRGYYDITFETLTETPAKITEGEITKQYMLTLEQDILKDPSQWLWSHRRWKHKPQK
jgi:KDO2-lipid IV(A) lauroyltransferase